MLGKIAIFRGESFEKSFFQQIPLSVEKNVRKIGPWSLYPSHLLSVRQRQEIGEGRVRRVVEGQQGQRPLQLLEDERLLFAAFRQLGSIL
jgi:hypothetical protein